MRRIYLDQWVWINLARAALGRKVDSGVRDTLEIALSGAEHGLVSFPLSPAHYMELRHAPTPMQRQEIGQFMLRLSRGHTMIGPVQPVVDAEIDAALFDVFGRPTEQRTMQVFGTGFGHALGVGDIALQLVEAAAEVNKLDPAARERLLARTRLDLERFMITGPLPGDNLPDYDPSAHLSVAEAFVANEVDQAQKFATYKVDTKYQRTVLLEREWKRLRVPVTQALTRAGISPEGFFGSGPDFLTTFLEQLPVVFTTFEMRQLQHQMPQRKWKTNDQFDISFLSMATVHCDVLVTENHWATQLRRAGLDKRWDTKIVTDFAVLSTILAASG